MAALEKVLAAITTDAEHAERICRLCDVGACPLRNCPVERAGGEPRGDDRPEPRPILKRHRSK